MSGTNDNNDVLYLHITPCGKKYFGVTGMKPKQRWRKNGNGYKPEKDENGNEKPSHFWTAIQKYGWDNITHVILADNLTPDEADMFEIFLIAYYDTTDPSKGYNLDRGGRGENKRMSEESKQKISKANKGKHFSEQHKQKLSRSNPNSKTVICITTGECYRSTKEVERKTGIRQCDISRVCTGKRKTVGELSDGTRLKWAYVRNLPKPQVSEETKQLLSNGPKLLKVA